MENFSLSAEGKEKAKKFIIGLIVTFCISLVSKAIVLIGNSETVGNAIGFVLTSFPALTSSVLPAIAGGCFAVWQGNKDC